MKQYQLLEDPSWKSGDDRTYTCLGCERDVKELYGRFCLSCVKYEWLRFSYGKPSRYFVELLKSILEALNEKAI